MLYENNIFISIVILIHLSNSYEEILTREQYESNKTNMANTVQSQDDGVWRTSSNLFNSLFRRQELQAAQMPMGNLSNQVEGFYEPYHKGGEWVFLRTTSQTLPPDLDEMLNAQANTPPTTPMSEQAIPMGLYRACQRGCVYLYRDYGKVCGKRLNTTLGEIEYHNFTNICELKFYNCMYPNKRPNWFPAYRGFCTEYRYGYSFPNDSSEIASRAAYFEKITFPPNT